jgi:hypothetical protein
MNLVEINVANAEICCQPGIYKNPDFDNKCSLCFYKSNPTGYDDKVLKGKIYNPTYTIEQLEVIVNGRKMPKKCGLYIALCQLCEKEEDSINEFIQHVVNVVQCIKNTTNYRGWTAEQAAELIGIYASKKCGNDLHKVDHAIQHIICSGVIDWWNLEQGKVGGVGYCYYSNFGKKPQLYKTRYRRELNKIDLPQLFSKDGLILVLKKIYGNNFKMINKVIESEKELYF